MSDPSPLRLTAAIRAARDAGRPIVALESSVLAQGLPIPANRDAADRMTGAVERAGAVPAVTAVVHGVPTLGLEPAELERFLAREGVRKVSARDLAPAMLRGHDGATTVAASLAIGAMAGVEVFATGGIGGVHREAPGSAPTSWVRDESADLLEMARSPMLCVCAGAKSILDLPATLERLETLGVPIVGYRTDTLPGFFTVDTGLRLPHRADTPQELAALWRHHRALGRRETVLVVQPPPADTALPRELVDGAVAHALADAARQGVAGPGVTPFLLAAVERATGGRSLVANLALLEANARLAGEVAVALAG
ncbi:pseudouridine-5'-phosphate glycosidase [Roseisolibacter agri]|uniref:Pseudouridine-5'-phosphate glycosidase n=1 Tax=Roseisolibacter agri TaxID=2014610 RepID=A0AA37V5N7_9BACT|nr:pseudouridine-5'-phosphate glycosidase [Roseisolibacter agri]GLC24356.1 pseudouridine-5'-phosphate glycosidase [Roseisolibacter agri]